MEQADGVELEVDFRQGSRRVQVNLELEDGAVRERVRIRDDADGSDIRIGNGMTVRAEPGDTDDDLRDDDRGEDRRDDDRIDDDNSGPGSDDDDGIDDDNSGPGSDDDSD